MSGERRVHLIHVVRRHYVVRNIIVAEAYAALHGRKRTKEPDLGSRAPRTSANALKDRATHRDYDPGVARLCRINREPRMFGEFLDVRPALGNC